MQCRQIWTRSRGYLASAFALAILLPATRAAADTVYWTDSSGNTVYYATTLPGGGLTGMAAYSTGLANGDNYSQPGGVAVDPAGDVFIVNFTHSGDAHESTPYAVEIPAGSTSGTKNGNVIFSGGGNLDDIAINSSGDLFVNSYTSEIWLLTPTSPGVYASSVWANSTTFANDGSPGGTWTPIGLGLDFSGNLYELAKSGGDLLKMPATLTSPTSMSLFTSQTFSQGLAVEPDASGDMWVADTNGGKVYEFSSAGTLLDTISGLSSPHGLTFDSSGDLWVAESTGHISEYTISGNTATLEATVNTPDSNPQHIAFLPVAVPEPATMALAVGGLLSLLGFGVARRRLPWAAARGGA